MLTANELNIIVSAKNLASNVLKTVGEDVKRFGGQATQYFNSAREASEGFALAVGVASGVATAGIIHYGSEVQDLNNKIKSVSDTQEEANQLFEQLGDIAIDARSDFSSIVGTFQRFEMTNKSLGKETAETLEMVEALSKGLAYSGASAQEAASASLQLGQAYASGRLQGDEFRSLSEAFPLLMITMSEQLGITTAELKKMGSEGNITRDIIENALMGISDSVDKHLADMPVTIGQAFSIGRTIALQAFDDINQGTQIFDNIASAILNVQLRFKDMVPAIVDFINSINAEQVQLFAGAIIGGLTPAFIGLAGSIGLVGLKLAPFMIAGALIVQHWEPIKEFLKGLGIDFDDLGGTMGRLKETMLSAWKKIEEVVGVAVKFFVDEVKPMIQDFFDTIGVWVEILKTAWDNNWGGIRDIVSFVWDAIKIVIETAWNIVSNIIKFGLAILRGDWSAAWSAIKGIAKAIWDGIQNAWDLFWTNLKKILSLGKETVVGAWDGMWNGMKNIAIGIWDGIKKTIGDSINWIVEKVNSLIESMNSVPGVSIPLIPTVQFANGGIVQGATAFANGGIVSSPQLFGFDKQMGLRGEAGAEAIVPLPDGRTIPVTLKGGNQGGRGDTHIHIGGIHVQGSVTAERDLISTVAEGIANRLGIDHQIHY